MSIHQLLSKILPFLRILQSDWMIHFPPITRDAEFSWIWNFIKETSYRWNIYSELNPTKSNEKMLENNQKT